jgi:hypothetical protein
MCRRWRAASDRGANSIRRETARAALTDQDATDGTEETSRRFNVALFIVHPTIDPAEITAALGLEGHFVHPVGEQRKTPKGTLLPGKYKDTRWRHRVRHDVKDQRFAAAVVTFVDRLAPHKAFLHDLRSTGGRAMIIVQFLGDGYFGDEIDRDTLARLVDLELDFGLECFSTPQS